MPSPLVAIVILNWNGKKLLEQFLPSVLRTSYDNCKIIVADNGSTDDSVSFVRQQFPSVDLICIPENLGYADGYNKALSQVEADYFILLNSDVEVSPGWLQPMVALLQSNTTIAACQPKLLSWKQKDSFEYAGAAGGWIDCFGYPFAMGRVFDYCEKDKEQYDQAKPVFWASGAALFIRASVFNEMKGFDPYFFAHQEEIDLCWRMQLAGYKIYSCPQSVVWHVGGSTLPAGNSMKTFLNYRNNNIMLLKNLPLRKLWWVMPARFALDAIAAYKELFAGDSGYWLAVAKAHFAVLRWILGGRKKSLFPLSRKSSLSGVFRGSVLWAYFAKGQKTFTEIVKDKG